jgi:hypothetical protein
MLTVFASFFIIFFLFALFFPPTANSLAKKDDAYFLVSTLTTVSSPKDLCSLGATWTALVGISKFQKVNLKLPRKGTLSQK